MQTQDQFPNKKLSKQEYNKLYYQQNRERLMQKRKEQSQQNVLQLFANQTSMKSEAPKRDWRKLFLSLVKFIELIALIALTVTMTYWLVKESAGFYLDAKESQLSAYFKAGVIELTAILFSFSKGRETLIQWGQRIVLVLLCGLSLWTTSQRVANNASHDSIKAYSSSKIIRELETERSQKEALRERLLRNGRITMAKNYEKGLDQIREKLIAAHAQSSNLQAPQVITGSLAVLILFRLAILIANLICCHRIFEYFSPQVARHRAT